MPAFQSNLEKNILAYRKYYIHTQYHAAQIQFYTNTKNGFDHIDVSQ